MYDAIPTIYASRELTTVGGLMSHSAVPTDEFRQANSLQVNDEIELGRLLKRHVSRLCPAQNLIHVFPID